MIVVLEGPDGAGKSTLAHAIVNCLSSAAGLRVSLVHTGPPDPAVGAYASCRRAVRDALHAALTGQVTVFDRLHAGELVYGPIYRGASGITLGQAAELDSMLDSVGGIRAHVTAAPGTLEARVRAKDPGGVDPRSGSRAHDSRGLVDAYEDLLGSTSRRGRLPGWFYVPTDDGGIASEALVQVALQTAAGYDRLRT